MNTNTRLKSKYTLKRVIFEDMISYCYLGVNDKTNTHILVWKYKINANNHPLVEALIQRAEILMGLQHTLLLPLIDYVFDGISFYTIHPYIPKLKPLDTFFDTQDSPDLKQRWDIGKSVLQLIEIFESHHITCGAISTSSIHMCDNGKCVMIHAGIGILVMQAHIDQLTSSDDCLFLAPELIHNGTFNISSDLYALGVLFYYLFSDTWPYPYTLSLESHQKSLIGNPRPFQPLSASVPKSLSPIIMTCIECDISDRFESAATLQHALQGIIPIKPRSTTNKRSVIQEEIAQSFISEENKVKRMKRRWLIVSIATGLMFAICSYL
jgi:serine/threonine protein kinase